MENEPPRRRVRRAKQSRPVAPGVAAATSAAKQSPEHAQVGAAEALGDAAGAAAPAAPPEAARAIPAGEDEWLPEPLADSSRDGAWLPAGITVLVMVSLLICAGLVLIAAGEN